MSCPKTKWKWVPSGCECGLFDLESCILMITTVGQMSSLQNFKYYLVLIVPGEKIRILFIKLRFIVALTQKTVHPLLQPQIINHWETPHIQLQYWQVKDLTICATKWTEPQYSHIKLTCARYERKAMDWTVFPRPISSARMPLIPCKTDKTYQLVRCILLIALYRKTSDNVLSNHLWLPCERRHFHTHKRQSCLLMPTYMQSFSP